MLGYAHHEGHVVLHKHDGGSSAGDRPEEVRQRILLSSHQAGGRLVEDEYRGRVASARDLDEAPVDVREPAAFASIGPA
jgi:hypothetical protein